MARVSHDLDARRLTIPAADAAMSRATHASMRTHRRRTGAVLAVCAALLAPAAQSAGDAPAPPRPQPLAEGVWWIPGGLLPGRQPDGNSVVFRGPDGLVVVDTGRHRWHRQAILDLARAQKAPIVAIVNTHWHLDHVSGNPGLRAAHPAARVHASDAIDGALAGFLRQSAESARKYLETPGLPAATVEDIRGDLATTANGRALRPDEVVRESGETTLGGRAFTLNLARDGPTAGDVWLLDPATRIAVVGDLVTLPVPFLDTACVAGWQAALAQVAEAPFDRLVPGHGLPMSRDDFDRYRTAFDAFVRCARSEREASACTAAWSRDVAPLLEANGMDARRTASMATYYVVEVLRKNRGNSAHCARPG